MAGRRCLFAVCRMGAFGSVGKIRSRRGLRRESLRGRAGWAKWARAGGVELLALGRHQEQVEAVLEAKATRLRDLSGQARQKRAGGGLAARRHGFVRRRGYGRRRPLDPVSEAGVMFRSVWSATWPISTESDAPMWSPSANGTVVSCEEGPCRRGQRHLSRLGRCDAHHDGWPGIDPIATPSGATARLGFRNNAYPPSCHIPAAMMGLVASPAPRRSSPRGTQCRRQSCGSRVGPRSGHGSFL
jgi:hypothetical protein